MNFFNKITGKEKAGCQLAPATPPAGLKLATFAGVCVCKQGPSARQCAHGRAGG